MKFFLETASLDEVRRAAEFGLLDGVSTDPSLVARERKDYRYVVRELARSWDRPVLVGVRSRDREQMGREAGELARIAENIVVKLPATPDGLLACGDLENDNIPVDLTLVHSAAQALIAGRLGASFVSTAIGPIDDAGALGIDLVRDIMAIFDNFGFETAVVVGGVRNPNHVIEAALAGADVVSLPLSVLEALFSHPLTEMGYERLLADWEETERDLPIKRVIRGDKES